MSKDCWQVLEAIRDNPREDLTLAINTNLDVEPKFIEKFITLAKEIGPNSHCLLDEERVDYSGETKFEARGIRLGHRIWHLAYKKIREL